MFMKACFLLPDPQGEVGPSVSSSVVLCSIVHLVYIVVLVLEVYLCPSSVRVVATFSGTVLFPVLFFYVLLTVHLSISLDNDQLDTYLLYFTIVLL